MAEDTFPVVEAGHYPPELLEVCRMWNVAPGALLAWSVRRDGVSMILPSGQKVGVSIRGEWRQGQVQGDSGSGDTSCVEADPASPEPEKKKSARGK